MRKIIILMVSLMLSGPLLAQQNNIKGTITDESGLPLPGANVVVKNTTIRVSTDFDGKYEIKAKPDQILIFSYVGYQTKEITVGTETTIDVQLAITGELSEVVVVAYGTSSSVRIRGSSSISALEGKASGIAVTSDKRSYKKKVVSDQIAAGQLTAGEINDIKDWSDWKETINKNLFTSYQDKWNFFLQRKVLVNVKNDDGTPMNNVKVSIYTNDNKKIMSARTDVKGQAYVFLDATEITDDNYYRIQLEAKGKIKGKKIMKHIDTVDFVFNSETTSNSVDIMFTIDATGSMGDEINYLKAELKDIMNRVNADENIDEKRVALTFYRDSGDAYVVKEYDFETNIENVQNSLNQNYAGGGGDYEEALEIALEKANGLNWNANARSRLMFLILDAPPHFSKEIVAKIKNEIQSAQEKGIKIIPVVASGANKNLEFLMRFFSISTNGTYVFLTDDSGIGNSHLKPSKDNYKVEKLNDLIVRLIKQSVQTNV